MPDIQTTNALFTQQQLNQMLSETPASAYTGAARGLFTVDTSVADWAESYTTTANLNPGLEAEIVGYHSVLPNLLRFMKRSITAPIVALGGSVVYTVQEVANARAFSTNLDSLRLAAINEGVYRKEDRLTFRGDAATGIYGIGSHPQISQMSGLANGSSNGFTNTASWLGKTLPQIVTELGEILRLQGELAELTGAPMIDSVILPSTVMTYLQTTFTTPASPTTTMFDLLERSFPQLNFASSTLMNGLPLASLNFASETCALFYNRTSALSVVIPRDVTLEPTQAIDLKLSTPAHSRFGGIRVLSPEAVFLLVGV